MHYLIRGTVEPLGEGERVEPGELSAVLTELSGRAGMLGIVSRGVRRNGRCYVATAAGSPGRERFGRGFIVERVV